MNYKNKKIIVFDMDETIGSFQYLSFYYYILLKIKNNFNIKKKIFHIFLDLFPNIFRNNIFNIFNIIKKYKKKKKFDVVIYTNNSASRKYTLDIIDYIHKKLNYKLFDKIITKFGTNKIKREGYYKTCNDLIKHYKNKNIKILFFDDRNHTAMNNPIIKNVVLNPYHSTITFNHFMKLFNILNNKYKFLNNIELNNYKQNLITFLKDNHINHNNININQTNLIKNKIYNFLNIKIKNTRCRISKNLKQNNKTKKNKKKGKIIRKHKVSKFKNKKIKKKAKNLKNKN